jgi:hypothetical protein
MVIYPLSFFSLCSTYSEMRSLMVELGSFVGE